LTTNSASTTKASHSAHRERRSFVSLPTTPVS